MQNIDNQMITLDSFTRAKEKMISTSKIGYDALNNLYRSWSNPVKDYSVDEITQIINSGSLPEQQKLSRNYFDKDGYYKQILVYYATLLKYAGLLIPNPLGGNSLSKPHIQKRYYGAMDYIERMQLPTLLSNCALQALIYGSYYGVIVQNDKQAFAVIDLPQEYCRSCFKDINGNDIIEFDLFYFESIKDDEARKAALAAYPQVIAKAYNTYKKNNKLQNRWFMIPTDIGICFPFFDGKPLFLSVIPATIDYDEAIRIQRLNETDETKKFLIQKIPHLTDGRLLFEPDEAAEIHDGTVQMLRGNSNTSVITTYADVELATSKRSAQDEADNLTKIEQNIYAQAGVSGQLFASTGSSSLESSLNNDLSLMMYLANKFSRFITNLVNGQFSNSNINFKYIILPVTYYNTSEYVDQGLKLASSGYSFSMPAIALGLNQKDLGNVKDLENDILGLASKLIPLQTSYTQSGSNEGGRPEEKDSDKAPKTLQNEESLDNQAGGS